MNNDRVHQHVTKPSMAPFQPAQSLREFFDTFEIPRVSDAQMPVDRAAIYHLFWKLIDEEYREVAIELDQFELNEQNVPGAQPSREKLAKELADLVYVSFYAAEAMGIPLEKVFREVHGSNMSKLGEDGRPIKREDGKILKGPKYYEPDLSKLVA